MNYTIKNYLKFSIIISIFLILILSIGCGLFETDEEINAAVRAGDPNMCAKLDESEDKGRIDKCYDRVAQKLDDPQICARIKGSDRSDDCYSDIAVSIKDPSLCTKLSSSDEKDSCYHDVSEVNRDPNLCDKIDKSSNLHSSCITNAARNNKNIEICNKLTVEYQRNDCIGEVATSSRDMDACKEIKETTRRLACQTQIAVNSNDKEMCKEIESQSTREMCIEQIENKNSGSTKSNTCKTEVDCPTDQICKDSYCITPECTKDTSYCRGDYREFCHRGSLETERCIFGCENDNCLEKDEADAIEAQEEKENSCKDGYKKCKSTTTIEFCKEGKIKEGFCEFGCKSNTCQREPDVDLSGTIADLKDKQQFAEIASGPYMDALQRAIDNEKDPSKLAGLEAYQKFLGGSAEKFGDAVTTLEDLEKLKKIFVDQYDPSMDIENMNARDIYEKGLGGKLSDAIGGLWDKVTFVGEKSVEQQEQAQAEQQLLLYEAMLERKSEIEFLKKSRLERVGSTMVDMVKDKAAEEVKEKVTEIAKAAAGEAFFVVGYLGDAIQTVQDEGQNMMFTGLIKAYNRRRAALEAENPKLSNEEIHRLTVSQVEDFPYADAKTGVVIAKYGNLLANEDCTTEGNSNPLCIDRHAFWVSMDKSYQHFNDKKMFDRWLAQMKEDE